MVEFANSLSSGGADRVIFWMLATAFLFTAMVGVLERWYRTKKRGDAEKLFVIAR
jgi:hypothetical protein